MHEIFKLMNEAYSAVIPLSYSPVLPPPPSISPTPFPSLSHALTASYSPNLSYTSILLRLEKKTIEYFT